MGSWCLCATPVLEFGFRSTRTIAAPREYAPSVALPLPSRVVMPRFDLRAVMPFYDAAAPVADARPPVSFNDSAPAGPPAGPWMPIAGAQPAALRLAYALAGAISRPIAGLYPQAPEAALYSTLRSCEMRTRSTDPVPAARLLECAVAEPVAAISIRRPGIVLRSAAVFVPTATRLRRSPDAQAAAVSVAPVFDGRPAAFRPSLSLPRFAVPEVAALASESPILRASEPEPSIAAFAMVALAPARPQARPIAALGRSRDDLALTSACSVPAAPQLPAQAFPQADRIFAVQPRPIEITALVRNASPIALASKPACSLPEFSNRLAHDALQHATAVTACGATPIDSMPSIGRHLPVPMAPAVVSFLAPVPSRPSKGLPTADAMGPFPSRAVESVPSARKLPVIALAQVSTCSLPAFSNRLTLQPLPNANAVVEAAAVPFAGIAAVDKLSPVPLASFPGSFIATLPIVVAMKRLPEANAIVEGAGVPIKSLLSEGKLSPVALPLTRASFVPRVSSLIASQALAKADAFAGLDAMPVASVPRVDKLSPVALAPRSVCSLPATPRLIIQTLPNGASLDALAPVPVDAVPSVGKPVPVPVATAFALRMPTLVNVKASERGSAGPTLVPGAAAAQSTPVIEPFTPAARPAVRAVLLQDFDLEIPAQFGCPAMAVTGPDAASERADSRPALLDPISTLAVRGGARRTGPRPRSRIRRWSRSPITATGLRERLRYRSDRCRGAGLLCCRASLFRSP